MNEKTTLLKLFLSDVGMLTSIYGKATKLKIVNQENDINKGAVYENVIAQELKAHGYPLYYYNNKKWGEIDFVIEHGDNILPIEVKSGKEYEKHSALNHLLNEKNYDIPQAIVFSNENVKQVEHIMYLPIYMIMFLKREEIEFVDIAVEKFRFD